ncbi:hypothetical protein F4860DRAFT_466683 [Xylaria cubensis]|nr:hypothetical protein F4860DRAFT_466683 [Xylaria cubensis]
MFCCLLFSIISLFHSSLDRFLDCLNHSDALHSLDFATLKTAILLLAFKHSQTLSRQVISSQSTYKVMRPSTMNRLCQTLMALTLVVPALAVPGLMPAALQQQPMDMASGLLERFHRKPHKSHKSTGTVSQTAMMNPSPMSTDEVTTMTSPPTELLKRKSGDKPDSIPCTPGDRFCHASLGYVLFCNDDRKWVTYTQCSQGTICHRLDMICVPENKPSTFSALCHHSPQHVDKGGSSHECKEGDRRCSTTFNRVDRCNSSREWVTYHDCHQSELCDGNLLECLPLTNSHANDIQSHGNVTHNGTDSTSM